MRNISYSSDELSQLFSDWDTIMDMWDDNKSRSINDTVFCPLNQRCNKLIEISETVHTIIMCIEEESDSTY